MLAVSLIIFNQHALFSVMLDCIDEKRRAMLRYKPQAPFIDIL